MTRTLTILISEKNEQIIENLCNYFDTKPVRTIICPKDGAVLLENIRRYKPDVVICDVFMSSMDAISVKEKADSLNLPPQLFIIVSAYDNDDVINRAMAAGFGYYFPKPFSPESVYDRIISILTTANSDNISATEISITKLLHSFEMPSHLKGYVYIFHAIKLVAENPVYINNVTKMLYPEISEHFGTTASRVERSIRTAIEISWERALAETKEKYFPYYSVNYIKPTNSSFIACLADAVRALVNNGKLG